MCKISRMAAILGLAGTLAGLPALIAQDRDDHDEAGVREAISFERAKQAAADRQARIEAGRERGERADREGNSADRIANPDRNRPRMKRQTNHKDEHPESQPQH